MPEAKWPVEAVYAVVRSIPAGRVCTYGRVGQLAWGVPGRARLVGQMMSRCRDESVPCHRVVFADGRLTDGFGAFGRDEWYFHLTREGVEFIRPYQVHMALALWHG